MRFNKAKSLVHENVQGFFVDLFLLNLLRRRSTNVEATLCRVRDVCTGEGLDPDTGTTYSLQAVGYINMRFGMIFASYF